MKRLALCFREYAQMLSVDDKCIVPVGEPGDPISTGVRSHSRSLALSASTLAALDHDFHIHGIVPSVAFFVNIPESENDSFFQGKPFVTLMDKVTQASHALRHSAELASKDGLSQPLMILVSDSGHLIIDLTFCQYKWPSILIFLCVYGHVLTNHGKIWQKGSCLP